MAVKRGKNQPEVLGFITAAQPLLQQAVAKARPPKAKALPPDLATLNRLGREANDLYFSDALDKQAFLRILAEARQACGGDPNFLTFIYEVADPEWLNDELVRTP